MRSLTITCQEGDIFWKLLEEKRQQAGLDSDEEMALRLIRTSLGLPPEYDFVDMTEIEPETPKRSRLSLV